MYQFGPYTLDAETVRLFKDGVELEVEPQVFNTLLLLVEQRHRVITKDQLLQDIWHGRAVTDHVITRIIYELRKILDDKTGLASYIRTVRGKGYQFVGDVTEKELSVKNQRSRYSKILLLVLMTVIFYMLTNSKPEPQPTQTLTTAPAQNYPIVAVLPIRIESSSEELATLTQSLVDYLTTELSVNLLMKVIHPDNMMFLRNQFDDIWAVQKATRADFIIEGFLETATEDDIKIHLTLYKKSPNSELTPYALGGFNFPYPRTTKDLNDLYKQRKITVREIANIIKPGVVISDDGVTETHDPEAYRMVIAAHHIMRSDSCAEIYRAEELLVNATERDPEFAHAWNQLFSNYFKRIWVCGESTDNYQKALEVAEIVEKLAPN